MDCQAAQSKLNFARAHKFPAVAWEITNTMRAHGCPVSELGYFEQAPGAPRQPMSTGTQVALAGGAAVAVWWLFLRKPSAPGFPGADLPSGSAPAAGTSNCQRLFEKLKTLTAQAKALKGKKFADMSQDEKKIVVMLNTAWKQIRSKCGGIKKAKGKGKGKGKGGITDMLKSKGGDFLKSDTGKKYSGKAADWIKGKVGGKSDEGAAPSAEEPSMPEAAAEPSAPEGGGESVEGWWDDYGGIASAGLSGHYEDF